MKIFFLSNRNSCRSQIAEALLRKIAPEFEIYSAGICPADEVNPVAIEVMAEIGINIEQKRPEHYSRFAEMEFDYLITVGDGTPEELEIPPIKFKRKMHLGFNNPFKNNTDPEKIRECCREIRDEIHTEIDYFYHRILKGKKLSA